MKGLKNDDEVLKDITFAAQKWIGDTGELGYDGLNGTRKIGPSYAKSVV